MPQDFDAESSPRLLSKLLRWLGVDMDPAAAEGMIAALHRSLVRLNNVEANVIRICHHLGITADVPPADAPTVVHDVHENVHDFVHDEEGE